MQLFGVLFHEFYISSCELIVILCKVIPNALILVSLGQSNSAQDCTVAITPLAHLEEMFLLTLPKLSSSLNELVIVKSYLQMKYVLHVPTGNSARIVKMPAQRRKQER